MTAPTGRESEKFVLRLPDGMRDRIKAAADANKRSMNAEIVSRLADSLDGKSEVAALSINIDLSSIGEADLQAKLAILAARIDALKAGA